ncbi:MAG: response regulator transcription factor [Fimbriimonadales bacterium]
MGPKITVVVVEDEAGYRSALQRTLQLMPECELLAVCKDGQEGLDACLATPPDVLLTDIEMPRMDGITMMGKLLQREKNVAAVVLTTHEEDDIVFRAIKTGALGYLLKTSTPAEVIEAVRLAAKGEAKLTPRIAAMVLGDFRRVSGDFKADETSLYVLSDRENEILDLIGEGLRNKDIAERLGIAEKTVKNHVSSILRALQVNSRTEAAILATKKKGDRA